MAARRPDRAAMSRAGVEAFLMRFERVGRQALRTLPVLAERTIVLDPRRRPVS